MSAALLRPYLWPLASVGDATASAAHHGGLLRDDGSAAPRGVLRGADEPPAHPGLGAPAGSAPGASPEDAVREAVARLGLSADENFADYPDLLRMLRRAAPALALVPDDDGPELLVLVGATRGSLRVLGPDLRVATVAPEIVRSALCETWEAPLRGGIQRTLDHLALEGSRRTAVRQALLDEHLSTLQIGGCFVLGRAPGGSFRCRLVRAGVPARLLALLAAHGIQYALFIIAWTAIGRSALTGRSDSGALLAWGLLLLTVVPFRALAFWFQGAIAVRVGAVLKERLVHGALRMEPDEVRTDGVGTQLGRVIESEAVELFALRGGFLALLSMLELAASFWVLGRGAAGVLHPALLLGAVVAAIVVAWRYYGARAHWTDERLALTGDLVERMVGHRTRLAQEPISSWHVEEDRLLTSYHGASLTYDRIGVQLTTWFGRGWVVLAIVGLAPAFVGGADPTSLAIALGGILLAQQALEKLVLGAASLAGAAVSSRRVRVLFTAAARPERSGRPELVGAPSVPPDPSVPLLEGTELAYRYARRARPALVGTTFVIRSGDRILLGGPSGGGKSTWLGVVLGLRAPQAGYLLAGGLDPEALGENGWRRRVAAAPQFHENHVLGGSLAFNLLMGRRWPATLADYDEADWVCRRLGLGLLLDRMPAGLRQQVGESGWQLSHGERSRLFIARAVLQGAPVVVLDESLGALDPEAHLETLVALDELVDALVLVAH